MLRRVRVVDEAGQPAEGAPVICKYPDRGDSDPQRADAEGWVTFEINPADGATFRVGGREHPPGHTFPEAPEERRLVLPPFEPNEEPEPITLTLTAEQEAALRGE